MIPTEKDVLNLLLEAERHDMKITGIEFRSGVDVDGIKVRPLLRKRPFYLWGVACVVPARNRSGEFLRL